MRWLPEFCMSLQWERWRAGCEWPLLKPKDSVLKSRWFHICVRWLRMWLGWCSPCLACMRPWNSSPEPTLHKKGIVACDQNIQDIEAGRSEAQGHPWLHSQVRGQSYMSPCLEEEEGEEEKGREGGRQEGMERGREGEKTQLHKTYFPCLLCSCAIHTHSIQSTR